MPNAAPFVTRPTGLLLVTGRFGIAAFRSASICLYTSAIGVRASLRYSLCVKTLFTKGTSPKVMTKFQ